MEDENQESTENQSQATGSASASQNEEVARLIREATQQARDSVFAELRRNGFFDKKERPEPKKQEQKSTEQTQALSAQDVQQMMARDRAFVRATRGYDLSEQALSRMERHLSMENPDDVGAWVQEYATDLGIRKVGETSAPSEEATQMTQPAKQGPSAAPAGIRGDDSIDPYSLTEDDVERLIRQHGMHGAGKKLLTAMRAAPRKALAMKSRR